MEATVSSRTPEEDVLYRHFKAATPEKQIIILNLLDGEIGLDDPRAQKALADMKLSVTRRGRNILRLRRMRDKLGLIPQRLYYCLVWLFWMAAETPQRSSAAWRRFKIAWYL